MPQTVDPTHLGPEVFVEDYLPALTHAIENVGSILSRAPRVANYQTIAINPSNAGAVQGSIIQLSGFDASRARSVVWASSNLVYVGNRENLEIAGSINGSTPGVLLPQFPTQLELHNTGHLWAINQGSTVAYVFIVTESYSAQ